MQSTKHAIGTFLVACPLSFQLLAVQPVLDGHAYVLNSDINLDLDHQIISFESNMFNCQQSNGSPPVETLGWTLFTNEQSIGLSDFYYQTETDRVYLTSETSNVICDNAVYVDTLFEDGFE